MPYGLKGAAQTAASSAWGIYAEFVTRCYYFTAGPVNQGEKECLIRPVRGVLVAGALVQVGDSEMLIPAAQMTAVSHPVPGDYLLATADGRRWDVVAGQLDASQTVMKLVVRRVS